MTTDYRHPLQAGTPQNVHKRAQGKFHPLSTKTDVYELQEHSTHERTTRILLSKGCIEATDIESGHHNARKKSKFFFFFLPLLNAAYDHHDTHQPV
jgi:hypothetical protein